jgi:ribonuclease E
MLDSERNTHETDTNGATGANEATGHAAGTAPVPTAFNGPAQPAVPAAVFQAPQVLFQPPPAAQQPQSGSRDAEDRDDGRDSGGRDSGGRDSGGAAEPDADALRPARRTRSTRSQGGGAAGDQAGTDGEAGPASRRSRTRTTTRSRTRAAAPDDDLFSAESAGAIAEADDGAAAAAAPAADDAEDPAGARRRRRRNSRTRSRAEVAADADDQGQGADGGAGDELGADGDVDGDDDGEGGEAGSSTRRRRRKRRRVSADGDVLSGDDPPDTVVHVREPHNPADDVRAIKGSTRLEAKRQRRREGRESGRRRPPVITESEFLARRESVERTMVVRQRGDRTQIAVLEDGVLVEHYVNRTTHASYVGNVYLGKVQNVLPSMEAAFVDIGKGRNAVLYAGEVNFDASGLEGQPKRIESALKPGQSVIVQVTKDPMGHKGARLTSQVSLPGRYLVYVPGASMTGISRKLPDTERTRLKAILKKVTPENGGVIVRTAAEGAAEAELDRDITRLAAQWESIEKKAKTASAPALLYGEPDLTVRVIRDVFNEDFGQLIVSGEDGWEIIDEYVRYVAPHLADRISRWDSADNEDANDDVFAAYRIDEQLAKALERKVWLPSGGSLVIDRTEAMTVVDVNTGKFTGQGGNLEETVTRNNLEAAEELVRQLRLRDVGGIVVIDFIDMVLESNRELVLRRLLECLARDRTKHQVAEVTSLGLVQMTRKRVGAGLIEAFSQQCECCNGRGVIVALDAPAEPAHRASAGTVHRPVPAPPSQVPGNGNGKGQGNGAGGGRGGNAGGRRGTDRRGGYSDAAQDNAAARAESALAGTALADSAAAGPAKADSAPGGAGSAPAGVGSAPGGNGTATAGSAAPRTRRSTSAAGRAFATAVLIDDEPALVPVVPTVPPVTEPATAVGDTATDAPPVRRTRAGSAVARVTVTAEPQPAPEPDPAADPVAPATDAAPATDSAAADTAAPDTAAPDAEAPEAAEPTVVPASMFAAMPAGAEPEPAAATDAAPAEPEAATSTDEVAAEAPQADQADQGAEAPEAPEA